MSMTERAIQARILDRITDEEADLVSEIDLRVQREIMCPVTGKILDSRTALLVTAAVPDHPTYPAPFVAGVIHPDGKDELLRRAEIPLVHEGTEYRTTATFRSLQDGDLLSRL